MSIDTNHCARRARTDFRNEDEHPVSHRMETVVIMDEEDAVNNDYLEASRRCMEFFDRAAMFIYGARDPEHRLMRLDCVMLALGRHHIVNHNTAASLARMHGVPEQSIVGTMKRFQDFLGLPPVNGQNSNEQRKEKSKARKGNLK